MDPLKQEFDWNVIHVDKLDPMLFNGSNVFYGKYLSVNERWKMLFERSIYSDDTKIKIYIPFIQQCEPGVQKT